jgi:hypothetical protein
VGSTLALAQPHYYDRLVQLASTIFGTITQATTIIVREEIVEENVNEPSLRDPLGECIAQFECDLDLEKLLEQAGAFLDSTHKMQIENGETTEISSPKPSSPAEEPLIIDKKRRKEKRSKLSSLSKLSTCQLQTCPMTRK